MSGMPVPRSQSQQRTSAQAINDLFAAGPASTPPQISTPPPSTFAQPPAPPARASDPFASLAAAPRQASPFQYQQSVKPPQSASASVDLLGGAVASPTANVVQESSTATTDDDEWTFASSVPDTSTEITVTNTTVHVLFNVSRENNAALLIQSRISNNTSLPISGLTLQVAASKVSRVRNTMKSELMIHRVHNFNLSRNRALISHRIRRLASHKPFE